jgi:hypothetical protein
MPFPFMKCHESGILGTLKEEAANKLVFYKRNLENVTICDHGDRIRVHNRFNFEIWVFNGNLLPVEISGKIEPTPAVSFPVVAIAKQKIPACPNKGASKRIASITNAEAISDINDVLGHDGDLLDSIANILVDCKLLLTELHFHDSETLAHNILPE